MFNELFLLCLLVIGAAMIVGTFYLLWKGVINFDQAQRSGAISLEVADKIRVSSAYPAIALIVLALVCIAPAAWMAIEGSRVEWKWRQIAQNRDMSRSFRLHGEIQGQMISPVMDERFQMTISTNPYSIDITGRKFDQNFDLTFPQIVLTVRPSGGVYSGPPVVKPLNILEHNGEPLLISFEEAQQHRLKRIVLQPTATTDKLPDTVFHE